MVEDRITELEAKVDKLISWVKKEEKYTKEILEYSEELEVRITQLESKPKLKNNRPQNTWSDEEKNYLASNSAILSSTMAYPHESALSLSSSLLFF